MFGAVAKSDTDISALLSKNLGVAGRADATVVTAFTDGWPCLRTVLVNAGIPTPPILDWFHLAMRFQHATQAASGLLADNARRVQAKAVIVEEVERLRWRIWNGKAKDAKRSIDRIRKVMHVYKRESGPSTNSTPSRRLWYGTRCTTSTITCGVRAVGSSTMAGGTAQVFVLKRRSLRVLPTFWSIAA